GETCVQRPTIAEGRRGSARERATGYPTYARLRCQVGLCAALQTVVPPTGGVQPLWFSNAQAARGEIPKGLFSLLPATRQTLKQGRREVSDQFQYTWAITPERQHALFYATFHRSFAIAVVSAMDRTAFIEKHADRHPVVLPGAFR